MSNWKWCATDDNGKVIKGWYKDKDGSWYYMNEQGVMQTGWIQLKGIWYYLEENSNGYKGKCYSDCTTTINGKEYTFDKDGHMLESASNILSVSDDLAKFIEGFEGCKLKAYYCPSKVLTIGIGCTSTKWTSLGAITKAQAYEALKEDMQTFAEGVDSLASKSRITLNTYQREALISFSFNVGLGALASSTLWKNICAGVKDSATITENFGRWNKGSDRVLPGLTKRRACEARLYLTGNYSTEI